MHKPWCIVYVPSREEGRTGKYQHDLSGCALGIYRDENAGIYLYSLIRVKVKTFSNKKCEYQATTLSYGLY